MIGRSPPSPTHIRRAKVNLKGFDEGGPPPQLPLEDDGTVHISALYGRVSALGFGYAKFATISHRVHRSALALVYAALHHLNALPKSAQKVKLDQLSDIEDRSLGAGRTNKCDAARTLLRAMFAYAGTKKANCNRVHRDSKVLKIALREEVAPENFIQTIIEAGGVDKMARRAKSGQRSSPKPASKKRTTPTAQAPRPKLALAPPAPKVSKPEPDPGLELPLSKFRRCGMHLIAVHVPRSRDKVKLVRSAFVGEVKGKKERECVAQHALDAVTMGGRTNAKK